MSDIKCARMLLRAAERDLLALRSMSAAAPEEAFGFHVQQAAALVQGLLSDVGRALEKAAGESR